MIIYLFISSNTHTYNTFVGEHWVVEMIMHWWGIKGPKDANIIPIWCLYFFKHSFCFKPYVPREPRRNPSNRRLNEHGIYIRHCQKSNPQPVPSKAGTDTIRPQWRTRKIVSLYWIVQERKRKSVTRPVEVIKRWVIQWGNWFENKITVVILLFERVTYGKSLVYCVHRAARGPLCVTLSPTV